MTDFLAIYGLVCYKSTFESQKKKKNAASAASFVSSSLCLWWHKQGHIVAEVYVTTWANLSLLLIGKEETNMAVTWELKSEVKTYAVT